MKKYISVILCFVLVGMLLCSCSATGKNASDMNSVTEIASDRSEMSSDKRWIDGSGSFLADKTVTVNLDLQQPFFDLNDSAAYEENGGFSGMGGFCKNLIFSSFGTGDREQRLQNLHWGYYDINNQNMHTLEPLDFFPYIASHSNYVIMHDKEYYCFWHDDTSPENKNIILTKISASSDKVENLPGIRSEYAVCAMHKLDADHFIFFTYTDYPDAEKTHESIIYKYDCRTDTTTELLRQIMKKTGEKSCSGRSIEQISAYDDSVFVLYSSFVDGDISYVMCRYDKNGTLQKEYNADAVKDYVRNGSAVIEMTAVGDFVYLISYESYFSGAFFKIESDRLESFCRSTDAYKLMKYNISSCTGAQNVFSSKKCSYMVFGVTPVNAQRDNFCLLNCKNGKVTQFKLISDNELVYVQSMRSDEYGNILVQVKKGYNSLNQSYYFDREFLNNYIF